MYALFNEPRTRIKTTEQVESIPLSGNLFGSICRRGATIQGGIDKAKLFGEDFD